MHPVETILQAAAEALVAELAGVANVFVNRDESVGEDEMPCICVNYGNDTPDPNATDFQTIGSSLEVLLTAKLTGALDSEVREKLIEFRASGHRAMRTASSAWLVEYGGATKPMVIQSESYVGEQTSRWVFHYQMPNDHPE
jgi:hypothetical protein